MSTKVLTNLDLNQNQILNLVVQVLASDPGTPAEGQFWYNSTSNVLKYYDGTTVQTLGTAGGGISNVVEDTTPQLGGQLDVNGFALGDGTLELLSFTETGSAVNHVNITNAATGGGPTVGAVGDDTDVDLTLAAKGAGQVEIGGNRVLTTGDEGTGNGLDADTVDGSEASALLARANHTGSQTASTISDFDTQVRTSRLDQMAAPTATVSFNSQTVSNVADPSSAQDAATKAYVDAVKTGLDVKASVRAATTAAGTLASDFEDGDTVDGVVLATGDRILIKNQASGAENGIYTVNASGAPTRAVDADAAAEVTAGLFTFVAEGTANADSGWVLTTNDPITVDTTALTFAQFSGAGQITAGGGLTKSGNTLDVGAGTGITVNADDVAVNTSVVVRKHAETIGDGVSTAIAVTHNLGTEDVTVEVYDATTKETVLVDVDRTGTNEVTVTFAVAPSTNSHRVVVHG